MSTTVFVLLLILGSLLYFTPTIIAWNKRNISSIFALNLLLGWSVIGWVIALVWSLGVDRPTEVKTFFVDKSPTNNNALEQLERLQKLKDSGVLDESEFKSQKQKILR